MMGQDVKMVLQVLRSQAGDDSAFGELYRLYGGKTHTLIRHLIGSEPAQDVNQETWITVYKGLRTLVYPDKFKTWLYRIAHNQAMAFLRSAHRRKEMEDFNAEENEIAIPPDEVEIAFEKRNDLGHALAQLSPRLREVIVLHYFEGMDYAEMALILGCSPGTVRSRVHNAKKSLKQLINKSYHYENITEKSNGQDLEPD